jgi:oligopeptide transport system ATP-binding protein
VSVSLPQRTIADVAPTTDVLQLDGVSVHFEKRLGLGKGRQVLHAVEDVSLQVRRGEVLGIVGESGCGKSTLGRTMIGLQRATRGTVRVNGEPLRMSARPGAEATRLRLQMVFQDPVGSLNPRRTVGAAVREPLQNDGVRGADLSARVAALLDDVGLARSYADRYPEELSGGQQQRVAIARALATDPRLIVFDEAVSALDVSTQAQVLNLLRDLQEARDLTYVFISHDLSVIRFLSSRVAVMYLGRLVELGDVDAVGADALHPYSVALGSAVPSADPVVERTRTRITLSGSLPSPLHPPSGCAFHTRCPVADADRCVTEPPPLLEHVPDRLAACHYAGEFQQRYRSRSRPQDIGGEVSDG